MPNEKRILTFGLINQYNIERDLYTTLLHLDADLSDCNEECKAKGYDDDLKMFIAEAMVKHDDFEEILKSIVISIKESCSIYVGFEYKVNYVPAINSYNICVLLDARI